LVSGSAMRHWFAHPSRTRQPCEGQPFEKDGAAKVTGAAAPQVALV
jgi:hypothetical protein